MSSRPHPAPPRTSRLVRRFLGVAVLLAVLIPLTLGVEAILVRNVGANTEAIAHRQVEATHRAVQAQLTHLLESMEEDAQNLAAHPVVRQVLGDPTTRTPTLVRSVLEAVSGTRSLYRRAPTEAVELYRPDGALFAWSGFAAPLDRLTLSEGISDTLRTAVAMDGPRRRTITLWLPVRRGEEVIGAVRVMHRAQVSVPVRNRYLQDYNLADEWRSDALPPFSILFTEGQSGSADASQLLGLDGTLLGWVSVDLPAEGFLTGQVLGLTQGVIAFWMVLLAGWLMAGIWYLLYAMMHRASSTGSSRGWRLAGALLVGWCLSLWAIRYGLLVIDVPALWLASWRPGAALFDPNHLASEVGVGVLGSAGDLIVTVVFAVVFAVAVLRFALVRTASAMHRREVEISLAGVVGALVLAGLGIAAIAAFSVGARHAVLDATLGYFERSGPIPDRITFVVLMALLAGAFAAIAFAAACVLLARISVGWNRPAGSQAWKIALGIAGGLLAVIAITNTSGGTPSWVAITLFAFSSAAGALFLVGNRDRWAWPLTFRGMLFSVLVLVTLTYVVMARADRERENVLIEEAAEDFARGQDQRAVYAIEQVLTEARSQDLRAELIDVMQRVEEAAPAEPDALAADSSSAGSPRATFPPIQDDTMIRDSERVALDDFVSRLVSGSFLASLADYSVDFAVLNAQGDTLATYVGDVPPDDGEPQPARVGKDDPLAFDSLRSRYQREERPGFLVLRAPVGSQRGTYRYAGIGPVEASAERLAGWLHVEAMPRLSRPLGETPYPRVLVPARVQDEVGAAMSYSEYDNGVLVRSRGPAPGPFLLDVGVRNAFAGNRTEYWRQEIIEDRPYRAYYQRIPAGEKRERLDAIAVRLPAPSPLDHLFNLLRMTIAGLILGLLVYLVGLPIRRRAGLLPVSRSQFRDQVLSRFLLVGIATVAVTGMIGRQVIVAQNEQSVESLLRLRLQRVEAAVTAGAGPGTPVSSALERARADVASAQLGIDLHVYRGYELVSTSRPQLVRQRFIDERLPADVYRALYAEGRRYAFTKGRIGTFAYTIGYKAIADERGRTIGAVAVPTLPEQASIEAGQARMIAYLFGILLVLMLGIFVTTTLLANQLTRPFKRLRAGLKAVGEGQIYEPIPVETQDEMGQLAETFNEMQSQLKESRRQLAQQEREMAWREMAQQVAHEIKNPLTPMKLSVQHLRRAHRPLDENAAPEDRRFGSTLDRITTTLIEQIDALGRIAGEFSSFARLPQRNPERLDLNEVVREAAALFDDEASAEHSLELKLDLAEEPLFVEADREELRRAYINLFTNALQAMPNGKEGRITVRTSTSGVHAISDVQDNGAGIPEKARARIFQPNFSTKTSGMGLGLAIVKKTIEAGGGTIWFETEEGKGTTFHIRTPLTTESLQEGD
ncbi:MAG: HAMP domain-containing protein [Bacteroidetes bacterium]|nr:HAMP domain-containing protein [Bacteroidota bacterium]